MENSVDEGRIAGLTDFFYQAVDVAREQVKESSSAEFVYAALYVLARLEPGVNWDKFLDEALREVLYQKGESGQMIDDIARLARSSLHLVN